MWTVFCVLMVLIFVVVLGYYYYLNVFNKKRLTEEENENIKKRNEILILEKDKAALEYDKQQLTIENMVLKINQLESEKERLKDLLNKTELPSEVKQAMHERVELLNIIFATAISSTKSTKPTKSIENYESIITAATKDKANFIQSTRLAFMATHPTFMAYLDSHALTEYELDVACLYAIGLRGKDICNYIEDKRLYHINVSIRKKLGINSEINLNRHIKEMFKSL